VVDWLRRHSGRRTLERIWLPLLKAKLGDAWQRTSAAFIWATIQRMYAARHGGHKHEMFGYLPGGYGRMLAVFRQRLEALGVTNVTDPAPFTGVIEMTALVDPAQLNGRTLIYLPKYVTQDDPYAALSDSQIQSEFLSALKRLFPQFDASDVLAFRISRVRHVF